MCFSMTARISSRSASTSWDRPATTRSCASRTLSRSRAADARNSAPHQRDRSWDAERTAARSCGPPGKQTPQEALLLAWDREINVLTLEAPHRIGVGASQRAGGVADRHRLAEVGGAQHLLALRDDAEERDR